MAVKEVVLGDLDRYNSLGEVGRKRKRKERTKCPAQGWSEPAMKLEMRKYSIECHPRNLTTRTLKQSWVIMFRAIQRVGACARTKPGRRA